MDHTDETTSVLLLERSRPVIGSRGPTEGETAPEGEKTVAIPSAGVDDLLPPPEMSAPPVTSRVDFHGPALGALAAASILVGYRWIGVIPVNRSGPSSLVFGRSGALVFALLALWLAWAAGRAKESADDGHRPRTARLLVLAASTSILLAAGLVVRDVAVLRYGFGVSELLLASAAGGLLLLDERRRRRAGPELLPVSSSSAGRHGAATT